MEAFKAKGKHVDYVLEVDTDFAQKLINYKSKIGHDKD
jgi:hypothetical protein